MEKPNSLCFVSPVAGPCALIEWEDGSVTMVKREKDGAISGQTISSETLDAIAELRGPLPGAKLAP